MNSIPERAKVPCKWLLFELVYLLFFLEESHCLIDSRSSPIVLVNFLVGVIAPPLEANLSFYLVRIGIGTSLCR